MRVLYEADVRALLAAAPLGTPRPSVSCLLDLQLAAPVPGAGRAEGPAATRLAPACWSGLAEALLREVAGRRPARMDLVLFGGEPLLELERVLGLLREIRRACLASGVDHAAHVITDGAFLDVAAARQLAEAGVARLQVGLDAPRDRAAGTSWSRVLDAVASASAAARVVLRVAPDGACDLERVVDALEARGLAAAGGRIAVYLAQRATGVQQARELVAVSALLEAPPALLQ